MTDNKIQIQSQMFANRLRKRFTHLKKWAQRTGTGAFRLYDRDIPEIPLVLDFYGDCTQIQNAAVAGALYKRPYEKDHAEEETWLSVMKDSIQAALGINRESIFIKHRQRQRGASQYEKTGSVCFEKIICENDLVFKVNLSDYLDTGLFPDRRLLRTMVRSESSGKKVLNLFSYTGSFSVYAASGGAVSTDSIDLSNTYLSWARDNFSLNGFSAQIISQHEDFNRLKSQHIKPTVGNNLIRADVLKFLAKAVTSKKNWDIIILDPPVFSNSKKMEGSFDLKRDLNDIVNYCIRLLAPAGKLFLSINKKNISSRFSLSPCIKGVRITDLYKLLIDEDFRGKKMPLTFLIDKN